MAFLLGEGSLVGSRWGGGLAPPGGEVGTEMSSEGCGERVGGEGEGDGDGGKGMFSGLVLPFILRELRLEDLDSGWVLEDTEAIRLTAAV